MVTAKCTRCLGSSTGTTFDEAAAKINHAVSLSRGIKCGDNYNKVVEVKSPKQEKVEPKTKPKNKPKINQ